MNDTYSGHIHVINENTNQLDQIAIESLTMKEFQALLEKFVTIELIVFNVSIMLDEESKKWYNVYEKGESLCH